MQLIDLMEAQEELTEMIMDKRENGYTPRKKTLLDIKLSIDDELQEWLKELPQKYNFKTWKQKEYNREREREELTDVLFFLLELANEIKNWITLDTYHTVNKIFSEKKIVEVKELDFLIEGFKGELWESNDWDSEEIISNYSFMFEYLFKHYVNIVKNRGFSIEEIVQNYKTKWEKNVERIKGEWSI